ncbi:MAG: hypothetical protein AAGE52_40695 [Myxococcota bacterium]
MLLEDMLRDSIELLRISQDRGVEERPHGGSWRSVDSVDACVCASLISSFLSMANLEPPTSEPTVGEIRLPLSDGAHAVYGDAFYYVYARPCRTGLRLVIHRLSPALASKTVLATPHPELRALRERLGKARHVRGLEALRAAAIERGDSYTELWSWSQTLRALDDPKDRLEAARAMEEAAKQFDAGWLAVEAISTGAEALGMLSRFDQAIEEATRAVVAARLLSTYVPWTAEAHVAAAGIFEEAGRFRDARSHREQAAILIRDLVGLDDLWASAQLTVH